MPKVNLFSSQIISPKKLVYYLVYKLSYGKSMTMTFTSFIRNSMTKIRSKVAFKNNQKSTFTISIVTAYFQFLSKKNN